MSSGPQAGSNRFQRHRWKLVVSFSVLLTLAVDCTAGRLLLRGQIREPHGYYHHGFEALALNIEVWGNQPARYVTNSLGLRDLTRREVPLASTAHRILLLGDSFAEGVGVRYPLSLAARLQDALPGSEVLNAAVVSYSPRLSELKLRHLLDVRGLEIDEVVLFVDISDVQDEVLYEKFVPHEIPLSTRLGFSLRRFLKGHSYTAAHYYAWSQQGTAAHFDEGVFPELRESYRVADSPDFWKLRGDWSLAKPPRPAWIVRGLALLFESLGRIERLCHERDLPLTLVAYPWPQQMNARQTTGPHVDGLRDFAARHELGLVDLYPAFIGDRPIGETYAEYFFEGDVHWNAAGHQLVADHIASALPRPRARGREAAGQRSSAR